MPRSFIPSSSPSRRRPQAGAVLSALSLALACLPFSAALAHGDGHGADTASCPQAALFGAGMMDKLSPPYTQKAELSALTASPLGVSVLRHLWMNPDRSQPCFAHSDTTSWDAAVSGIPANITGIQISRQADHALIYFAGVPDYQIETPKLFTGFKPGNLYTVYKLSAHPQVDPRAVHELASRGAVGLFTNGHAIFNYSDTFSYENRGAWSYDANVAETAIVNSDIAHATPSGFDGFPDSRGVFHNHQMSRQILERAKDAYARGVKEHSGIYGFAIDSFPIYGPLGYSSADESSGIKALRSSYAPRAWLDATNHRSSLPGWTVNNWDGLYAGETLLNLFRKAKADMLYTDGAKDGPIQTPRDDTRLTEEIRALSTSKGLKRDEQGYVYWETEVSTPGGQTVATRNYLLKSSTLWGPDFDAKILPASYQTADRDKFLFTAVLGSFTEDYDFIPGYGDLDFYNGIESYVPERKQAVYHYVTPFHAELDDPDRLSKNHFPYFIGIQYKGIVDPFNATDITEREKADYLTRTARHYQTVFDLGVIGKTGDGKVIQGSVIETWRETLAGGD